MEHLLSFQDFLYEAGQYDPGDYQYDNQISIKSSLLQKTLEAAMDPIKDKVIIDLKPGKTKITGAEKFLSRYQMIMVKSNVSKKEDEGKRVLSMVVSRLGAAGFTNLETVAQGTKSHWIGDRPLEGRMFVYIKPDLNFVKDFGTGKLAKSILTDAAGGDKKEDKKEEPKKEE